MKKKVKRETTIVCRGGVTLPLPKNRDWFGVAEVTKKIPSPEGQNAGAPPTQREERITFLRRGGGVGGLSDTWFDRGYCKKKSCQQTETR